MKFRLEQGVAVVTGAAQGIGAALAAELARRGCHLALADPEPDGFAASAAAARSPGVRLSQYHLDIADASAGARPVSDEKEASGE